MWCVSSAPPHDRCPGVLRVHQAVDGALLRLRVPGGQLSADSMARLRTLATEFADGDLHLTSRGNLQLRGVPVGRSGDVPADLVAGVVDAGLLPSATHERVRNICASPLSGRVGGLADVRPMVRELDRLILANPLLAQLPGRFLFTLDDGRGDVAGLRSDLGVRLVRVESGKVEAQLVHGSGLAGARVPLTQAAAALALLAERFLRLRHDEWHVAALPRRGAELGEGSPEVLNPPADSARHRSYGLVVQDDGRTAITSLPPLAVLSPARSAALVAAASSHGSGELVLTPWRGVVVPDVDPSAAPVVATELAALGLVVDDGSPWTRITACAGAPSCAKAAGSTDDVARRVAEELRLEVGAPSRTPVHVVACERRCGAPAEPHRTVTVRSLA